MEKLTGSSTQTVTAQNTALHMGSGSLEVFATPALVALMEAAACDALAGTLPGGTTTVGTYMEVHHTAATPLGMEVRARAELVQEDGRNYTFAITAWDDSGEIGRATHRRVAVKSQRFMEKVSAKMQ